MAFLSAFACARALAANPILPSWEHIPDAEPRLFGDRVYLYGSHDKAGSKTFCDTQLRVWSAPLNDLNNWTDHGISFATRAQEGHGDDVPWSDNDLYAPDVVEKGGKYYLFAYVVGAPCAVAVSDTPTGPFKLVSKIKAPAGSPNDFGGWGQYIDPGVLVDDDGKVYIYWGYKSSHMAQLNPDNMVEILPGTYQADIIPTQSPFNFFEACSPRKINGTYYMVYADGGILVYATSKSPLGPFTYGGPIIRNGRDYPGGNIHGGLVQLNGQWYIFYHRMTNNTIMSRKACVERVTIESDGSIKEVDMTSLGFEEALDPYREVSADIACVLTGGNYITEIDRTNHPVINNRRGSVIGFKYLDFGPATKGKQLTFTTTVRQGQTSGHLTVWVGAPTAAKGGVELGSVSLDHKGTDRSAWNEVSGTVKAPAGRQALFFTFDSEAAGDVICDIKSFRFAQPIAK